MCDGNDQLNMSRTFATNLLLRYFHTATVTDNTFVTNALILTASTFIVLYRSEDTFAKQSADA